MVAKINVDYIGVVSEMEEKKALVYSQIPIDNPYQELLGKLQDIMENDNKSVLDMQGHFTIEFKRGNCPQGFNYCYPYSYSSSYVNGVKYPKIYSFEEYHEELAKVKESAERTSFSKSKKQSFFYECLRYVQALCFSEKLSFLKSNPKNLMFSSETIGWTTYNYTVNQHVDFLVHSNFGYGFSSYFFVNLKYKGIEILPYSHMVHYYHANIVDLIRYTNKYDVSRDNWNIALDFVVETSNEASLNEENFIKKWIVNEINEMMSGLERIAKDPKGCHDSLMNKTNELRGLISVRNISNMEIQTYKVYPDEMFIVLQAEKISGSLLFLEKLKALTPIYPMVTESIERIKAINSEMLPCFRENLAKIEREIEERQKAVDREIVVRERIEAECEPHLEAIQAIIDKYPERKKHSVKREYLENHKDLETKCKEFESLSASIQDKKSDIYKRRSFAYELIKYVDRIVDILKDIA